MLNYFLLLSEKYKEKYVFLVYIICLASFTTFAKEINYEKLEEIEKKLQFNELTYRELVKVEKDISRDINKVNKNIRNYRNLVSRGFGEKKILEKSITKDKESIKLLDIKIQNYNHKKSLIYNYLVFSHFTNEELITNKNITASVINNINNINNIMKKDHIVLKNNIFSKGQSLKKLNNSLENIELSLNKRSNEMESLLGESIINDIKKQKNKMQNVQIKKQAKEIKALILEFEKTKKRIGSFDSFKFSRFKDILPLNKISIKSIQEDKLKNGILINIKKSTLLAAPKDSLVVYADFFKGYGNMIILDLGNNYHLILSGLSNVTCQTGDWVEKGGILGDINKDNDEELYMEFRFKGKTINPIKWAGS